MENVKGNQQKQENARIEAAWPGVNGHHGPSVQSPVDRAGGNTEHFFVFHPYSLSYF